MSLPPTTRLSASIGNVCVQWARLESLVAHSLWEILDFDEEVGPIVTGGLDMLPRINMVLNLLQHKKYPRPIQDEFRAVRKAIQGPGGLAERRNQAVHGVHRDGSSELTVVLVMHRWGGAKQKQELHLDEVRTLGTEIHVLAQRLVVEGYERILKHKASGGVAPEPGGRHAADGGPDGGPRGENDGD